MNDELLSPPQGISNISEWAKRDACWTRMQEHMDRFAMLLPGNFESELLSREEHLTERRAARNTQRLDNGIEAQTRVLAVPPAKWTMVHEALSAKRLLTSKEIGILNVAKQLPTRIPSEKQCAILLDIIEKAHAEGISFE